MPCCWRDNIERLRAITHLSLLSLTEANPFSAYYTSWSFVIIVTIVLILTRTTFRLYFISTVQQAATTAMFPEYIGQQAVCTVQWLETNTAAVNLLTSYCVLISCCLLLAKWRLSSADWQLPVSRYVKVPCSTDS